MALRWEMQTEIETNKFEGTNWTRQLYLGIGYTIQWAKDNEIHGWKEWQVLSVQ